MADSNPYTEGPSGAEQAATPSAYCQECGQALSAGTLRRLPTGIYCVPCATQRTQAGTWQTVSGPGSTGAGTATGNAYGAVPNEAASPTGAFLLGFIPGVGAMYNGQYAKAALHLLIFVGLLSVADHLNGAAYWLVWGWVFYQVFDAYHTAKARREGLPLPDPFGWNDIGDRWSLSPQQPRTAQARAAAAPMTGAGEGGVAAPVAAPPPPPVTPQGETWQASSESYAAAGARGAVIEAEAGYAAGPGAMPYDQRTPPAAESRSASSAYAAWQPGEVAWQAAPTTGYGRTYMGQPAPGVPAAPVELPPIASQRGFPTGAIWLIGLGLLFLFGNVLPRYLLRGPWLMPLLLVGVAVWSGAHRLRQQQRRSLATGRPSNWACALTGPVVLLALAVLMALQAGEVFPLSRTWPVLLMVWGVMLLVQRALTPAASDRYSPESTPGADTPLSVTSPYRPSGSSTLGL